MSCPKCKEPQHCPCKACTARRTEKVVTWVHADEDGNIISCGHCGHTMTIDEWESHFYTLYKESQTDDG